jgi:hypothetical protein
LDSSHHFLLGDQMVDSLQQPQQALHVPAPLVQYIICVSWLGEVNDSGWTIDLSIYGLRSHQLADVLLRLIFCEVEKLGQAGHLDAGVVFGDDSDIVLDDALAEILPSLVSFLICRLTRSNIEDICAAEMRTEELRDFWPSHEFVNGEELEKLGIEWYLGISGISVNAVEEVGLFVVVGCEDDIVDDSLQDLEKLANTYTIKRTVFLRNEASEDPPQQPQYPELVCNACKHPGTCHHASPR